MKKQPIKQEIYIGEASPTPIGPIWVAAWEGGLIAVEFHETKEEFNIALDRRYPDSQIFCLPITELEDNPSPVANIISAAVTQIHEYLDGQRREFNLPIDWAIMTPFQEQVLRITYGIPYGKVSTYGSIAEQIGNPAAARAVGRAQATNPMPLVIPCHRVIGSDGGLHGYGGRGGLTTKAWLLRLENASPNSHT